MADGDTTTHDSEVAGGGDTSQDSEVGVACDPSSVEWPLLSSPCFVFAWAVSVFASQVSLPSAFDAVVGSAFVAACVASLPSVVAGDVSCGSLRNRLKMHAKSAVKALMKKPFLPAFSLVPVLLNSSVDSP